MTSSWSELVKTEKMVLKESMSDGDDQMQTTRRTKASKASMSERVPRREDTAIFWKLEGNGIFVSLL